MWSTRMRRGHLRETKYFSCKCERCADPSELGSHMSTLKCQCGEGLYMANDPLNPEADWSCNACPGIIGTDEVFLLVDRLGEEVEAAMSVPDIEIMSELLFR